MTTDKLITITIEGGCITDIDPSDLPFDYEVIDLDVTDSDDHDHYLDNDPPPNTVWWIVQGGILIDVPGLPDGYTYDVIDNDQP